MTGSQIDRMISELVEGFILDNNPTVLDDDLADVLSDRNQIDEAIDTLIKFVENYRENL